MVAAMVLVAVIAIGTGSVLLLGYLLAAASIGTILFIIARRTIKRVRDARLASPRLLARSRAVSRRVDNERQPRAA
jgi:hypothetical protein